MEIVLAILLLFGGFTLGSITADKSSDDNTIHDDPVQCGRCTGFASRSHRQCARAIRPVVILTGPLFTGILRSHITARSSGLRWRSATVKARIVPTILLQFLHPWRSGARMNSRIKSIISVYRPRGIASRSCCRAIPYAGQKNRARCIVDSSQCLIANGPGARPSLGFVGDGMASLQTVDARGSREYQSIDHIAHRSARYPCAG